MFLFQYTTKRNFHTLLFNFCMWPWYAFFWGLPHRVLLGFWHFSFWIQWRQTLGFRGLHTLSSCKIPLWLWYFDLESRQNSQWLQWESVRRAWRPGSALSRSIPNHAGWRQRHKPQLQTGTCTELGLLGFYFEWSLIISKYSMMCCQNHRLPQRLLPHLADDVTLLK